jgi:hypothetical protein
VSRDVGLERWRGVVVIVPVGRGGEVSLPPFSGVSRVSAFKTFVEKANFTEALDRKHRHEQFFIYFYCNRK